MKMRQKKMLLAVGVALASVLVAGPGFAQFTPNVTYSGKLQIGFSDQVLLS